MADEINKDPPPLAALSPELQTRVQNATVFIERAYGGLVPYEFQKADGGRGVSGSAGSGVIVANSGGRIVTNLHVVEGNDGQPLFKDPITHTVREPEIKVYTYAFNSREPQLLGYAHIVARGRRPGDRADRFFNNDQAVLEIKFEPGMEAKFKLLPGLPIAQNQSANLLAFMLPDRTAIKHGNSGGPAVNSQAELLGLNVGYVSDPTKSFKGVSYVTPMSNDIINRALLGDDSKKIAVYGPNGIPIRAVTYGYRNGVSDQLNVSVYQLPHGVTEKGTQYQPPVTSPFAAAAREVVRDNSRSSEPLPTFLHDVYKDGQLYDGSHKCFFRLGHSKDGKSFVDYFRHGSADGEVILYFDDKNQKIAQWMHANHISDPEGFFKRLLGNNKDDLALLYKTLNDVAQGKPDAPTIAQGPSTASQRTNLQRVPLASRSVGTEPHFSNTQILKGHKVNTQVRPKSRPRNPGNSI